MPNPSLVSRALAIVARPLACLTVSAVLAGAAQAAVVHHVSGGKLTGASGVIVSGVSYDVTFVDGSCIALFSGCDGPGDFVFNSLAAANAASQALLDFVMIDVVGGLEFDNKPELTNGCTGRIFCRAFTPYGSAGGIADVSVSRNDRINGSDLVDTAAVSGTSDTATNSTRFGETYAVWIAAPASATVPEPSSLALLGAAGFALGWSQRRRRLRANDRVQ